MERPILVTGAHRSGTTWVGRMLLLSGEAGYVHEPLNPYRWPGWARERIPHWYLYIPPGYTGPYEALVADVLRFSYPLGRNLAGVRHPRHVGRIAQDWWSSVRYRKRELRPLLKDPMALFASEWLAERFATQVVVMVRHPAAFASSLKRLGWEFKFKSWLAQGDLLQEWLAPFADEMGHQSEREMPIVDQAILLWRALYHVVAGLRDRHPEWLFVRHEDLSRDPIGGFEKMYAHLGLTWSPVVERAVARHTGEANRAEVGRWRHGTVRRHSEAVSGIWSQRLSAEEIARIKEGVVDVAPRFYSEEEW